MPEKASVAAFDQCTSCALASEKGSVNAGSLPTSHTEVCCLYKFARQGQPLCLKEEAGDKPKCDGLCENCPSWLRFRQLQQLPDLVDPLPDQPPPRSRRRRRRCSSSSSSDAAQDSEGAAAADVGTRRGSRVAPRRRRGFKKLTIEIRPPKFKKKLWFGTYEPEDVDRATDAINYYMGTPEPFHLPDSPLIFAQHKLGIEYRNLQPSCEQFVTVHGKRMRASAYFARQVKEVIKAVTGKKKGPQRRPKLGPKHGSAAAAPKHRLQSRESKPEAASTTPEPVISCASNLTSMSLMPCASDSAFSSVDNMGWDTSNVAACGAASSEAHSQLAPVHDAPSVLTPCEMLLTHQGEAPLESGHEGYFDWGDDLDWFDDLDWLPFLNSSAVAPHIGEGDMEMIPEDTNGFFSFPFSWS